MHEPENNRRKRGSSAKAGLRPTLAQHIRSYFLRHAQNFFGALGRFLRHPVANLMTVAVIGIALALPASLHILVVNGKALSGRWDSAVDISVYLQRDITVEEARALAKELETRADVAGWLIRIQTVSAGAASPTSGATSGWFSRTTSCSMIGRCTTT